MTESSEPAGNVVIGDVVIDVADDGLVSVWTTTGWKWTTSDAVVALAQRSSAAGERVTVGGAVESKLGRPVVERIVAVADVTVLPKRGDHPAGWIAVDGLDDQPNHVAAVDLVERAVAGGEARRLMLEAVRRARPRAYDVLREAVGDDRTPVPSRAGEGAISIPRVRRDHRWVAIAIAVGFLGLVLFGLLDGDDSFTASDLVGAPFLGFAALFAVIVVLFWRARKHAAVCFDGPMLWIRRGRNRWHGPIDVRRVAVYYDAPGRGGVSVGLAVPDPAGKPLSGLRLISDADRARIERTGARFRNHLLIVDGDYLLQGLGVYLDRYLDREHCVIGRHGAVLGRDLDVTPRSYDGLLPTP